jgi:hypothetical protein
VADRPRRANAGVNSRFDEYDTTGGTGRDQTGRDQTGRDQTGERPNRAERTRAEITRELRDIKRRATGVTTFMGWAWKDIESTFNEIQSRNDLLAARLLENPCSSETYTNCKITSVNEPLRGGYEKTVDVIVLNDDLIETTKVVKSLKYSSELNLVLLILYEHYNKSKSSIYFYFLIWMKID